MVLRPSLPHAPSRLLGEQGLAIAATLGLSLPAAAAPGPRGQWRFYLGQGNGRVV